MEYGYWRNEQLGVEGLDVRLASLLLRFFAIIPDFL
jgi:hypothetical protein